MRVIPMSDEFVSLGSARDFACWLRRLAATILSGGGPQQFGEVDMDKARLEKFALASRQRQHARSRALPRIGRAAPP